MTDTLTLPKIGEKYRLHGERDVWEVRTVFHKGGMVSMVSRGMFLSDYWKPHRWVRVTPGVIDPLTTDEVRLLVLKGHGMTEEMFNAWLDEIHDEAYDNGRENGLDAAAWDAERSESLQ